MSESSLSSNPFKVLSPEGMSGRDAVDLFVEVSEFNKIQDPGNTMLNGPRGSGKSMLFRYLMPDCQMIARQLPLSRLEFFAVLVPIKNTNPNITELRRLASPSAQAVLNEHLMTCFVASKVFKALVERISERDEESWCQATAKVYRAVVTAFRQSGWSVTQSPTAGTSAQFLRMCIDLCDTAYAATTQYAKRLSFLTTPPAYNGALCDYVSFLCPIIEELQYLPYFPNKPIYLLVDDADLLSFDQTKVLNSWIATRTSSIASMKLSTQSDYKDLFYILRQLHPRAPRFPRDQHRGCVYVESRHLLDQRTSDCSQTSKKKRIYPPKTRTHSSPSITIRSHPSTRLRTRSGPNGPPRGEAIESATMLPDMPGPNTFAASADVQSRLAPTPIPGLNNWSISPPAKCGIFSNPPRRCTTRRKFTPTAIQFNTSPPRSRTVPCDEKPKNCSLVISKR